MLLSSRLYFKAVTILAKQQHKVPGSTTVTKGAPVASTSQEKKKEADSIGTSVFISIRVSIFI
jgi:hypothetical protein